MPEKLEDWDPRWDEPSPQMHTLREHILTLQNDMGIVRSSVVDAGAYQLQIDAFNEQIAIMNTNITLLQLFAVNKITSNEMHNILKMYKSVDTENHEVAKATIAELIKSL
jgi:hypothetical protein